MTLKEYIKKYPDNDDVENIIGFSEQELTSVERAKILKSLANKCYLDAVVANWTIGNQEVLLNQQHRVAPSKRKKTE